MKQVVSACLSESLPECDPGEQTQLSVQPQLHARGAPHWATWEGFQELVNGPQASGHPNRGANPARLWHLLQDK